MIIVACMTNNNSNSFKTITFLDVVKTQSSVMLLSMGITDVRHSSADLCNAANVELTKIYGESRELPTFKNVDGIFELHAMSKLLFANLCEQVKAPMPKSWAFDCDGSVVANLHHIEQVLSESTPALIESEERYYILKPTLRASGVAPEIFSETELRSLINLKSTNLWQQSSVAGVRSNLATFFESLLDNTPAYVVQEYVPPVERHVYQDFCGVKVQLPVWKYPSIRLAVAIDANNKVQFLGGYYRSVTSYDQRSLPQPDAAVVDILPTRELKAIEKSLLPSLNAMVKSLSSPKKQPRLEELDREGIVSTKMILGFRRATLSDVYVGLGYSMLDRASNLSHLITFAHRYPSELRNRCYFNSSDALQVASTSAYETFIKMKFFLDRGFDPNQQEREYSNTPLHVLIANEAYQDAIDWIKYAKNKLDFSLQDREDKTTLIFAAKMRATAVVCCLVNALPADKRDKVLNLQDEDGNTALHYTFLLGDIDSAKELIAHGAKCDMTNVYGKTASQYSGVDIKNEIDRVLKSVVIDPVRDQNAIQNIFVDSRRSTLIAPTMCVETPSGWVVKREQFEYLDVKARLQNVEQVRRKVGKVLAINERHFYRIQYGLPLVFADGITPHKQSEIHALLDNFTGTSLLDYCMQQNQALRSQLTAEGSLKEVSHTESAPSISENDYGFFSTATIVSAAVTATAIAFGYLYD